MRNKKWIWVSAAVATLVAACIMETEGNDSVVTAFFGNRYHFAGQFQGAGTVGETVNPGSSMIQENIDTGLIQLRPTGPYTDEADHWLLQADRSLESRSFTVSLKTGNPNQCVRLRVRRCAAANWHPERLPANPSLLQEVIALLNSSPVCDSWHLFEEQVICNVGATSQYAIPDGDGIIDVVARNYNGVAAYGFQLDIH